jgi:hypothetical protein
LFPEAPVHTRNTTILATLLAMTAAVPGCYGRPQLHADDDGSSSAAADHSTGATSMVTSASTASASSMTTTAADTAVDETGETLTSESGSSSTGAPGVPIPAPVAYWSLDDATLMGSTVADVMGNHDGTAQATVGGFAGVVAEALGFDGDDAWVRVEHSAELEPLDEGSMAVWVRFTTPPSGAGRLMTIIDKGGFSTDYTLLADSADDLLRFYVGQSVVAASTTAVTANVWMHVAVTYRARDAIRIYVDGVLEGETTIGVRMQDDQALGIGEGPYFGGRHFAGVVDEVAVWNETLTPEVIAAIHGLGAAGTPLWDP